MVKRNNILICPLEWGLGHAARMIPVAKKLLELNQNVFIASGEDHLKLFREELPGVKYINFPGFKPAYSKYLPQYIPLLFKTPSLIVHIAKEHQALKKIIHDHSIDLVISDNRFGLWNKDVKTAYITHMPRIPFPRPFRFLEFTGIFLHRLIIKKYSLCLIPDLPGEINLSGRLSHGLKLPANTRYIGILSRFPVSDTGNNPDPFPPVHNTVILSGPEPQRSIFRRLVITHLRNEKGVTLILEGTPGSGKTVSESSGFESYSHLPSASMQRAISNGIRVITRAGYSTIMELVSLGSTALLVPTPGQTEQEYLGEYLSSRGWFACCRQNNLKEGIGTPFITTGFPAEIIKESRLLLDEALKELLD